MSDTQDDVNRQRLLGSLAAPPKTFLGHLAREEEEAREAALAENGRGGVEAMALLIKAVRAWPLLLVVAAAVLLFVFTGRISIELIVAAIAIIVWRVLRKRKRRR